MDIFSDFPLKVAGVILAPRGFGTHGHISDPWYPCFTITPAAPSHLTQVHLLALLYTETDLGVQTRYETIQIIKTVTGLPINMLASEVKTI